MIKQECFTREWCESVSRQLHYNDIQLIEKVVRALSLLELLVKSGCPFHFKELWMAIHNPLKLTKLRRTYPEEYYSEEYYYWVKANELLMPPAPSTT